MKKILFVLGLTLVFVALGHHSRAEAACGAIPSVFTNAVSTVDAATTNQNNTFLRNCATQVDNTQIGGAGIFGSQVICDTVAHCTFGTSANVGYVFTAAAATVVPLTITAFAAQSVDILDVNAAGGSGGNAFKVPSGGGISVSGTAAIVSSGTGAPGGSCTVGSTYLRSDAASGASAIYTCAPANTWTAVAVAGSLASSVAAYARASNTTLDATCTLLAPCVGATQSIIIPSTDASGFRVAVRCRYALSGALASFVLGITGATAGTSPIAEFANDPNATPAHTLTIATVLSDGITSATQLVGRFGEESNYESTQTQGQTLTYNCVARSGSNGFTFTSTIAIVATPV